MFASSRATTLLVAIFALIFISIGVVNQYAIRTFFDLGMVTHALYQMNHGFIPQFTLGIDGVSMPFLATHFSPIVYLYLPFYWIFGTYTPTFIQIAAILLAGIPVYKYAQIVFQNKTKSNLILIHFYLIWGIYGALSFDFHNNVIGAMLVPWIFLFLKRRQFWALSGCSILMVVTMETFGIWLFFILIGFNFWQFKNGEHIDKRVFWIAFLALIYSLLVVIWVMPSLQNSNQNLQIGRYSHLGNSIPEIIWNLIRHPDRLIRSFFIDFSNNISIAKNKIVFWCFLIFSGGFLIYKNPQLILIFIAPLAFKLLSKDAAFYGVYHQYSIEFVPLISIILIEGIKKIKVAYHQNIMVFSIISTAICTFLMLNFSLAEYDYKVNSRFYTASHFNPEMNVQQIKRDLKIIPDGAIVSASNCLSPYLFQRQFLYSFPIIKDAEYLAIIKNKRSPWPLTDEEHAQKIQELSNLIEYQILKESEDMIILKKRK